LHQGWTKKNAEELAPNIFYLTQRFNSTVNWVIYEILSCPSSKGRVEVFTHLLGVANELLELKNFHGAAAFVNGLYHHTITRLKSTIAKLSEKEDLNLKGILELFNGTKNYKLLKDKMINENPPMVPFLAPTLKELIYIDEGNPSVLEGGGINFFKFRRIYTAVSEYLSYQETPYTDPHGNEDLQLYMHNTYHLAKKVGDQGLLSLSKKRDKRRSSIMTRHSKNE